MQKATLSLGLLALALAAPLAAGEELLPLNQARDRVLRARRTLEVKIEAMDWYASGESLNLRFSLHNPTDETVWVLKWHLPSERMDAPMLQVAWEGEPLNYEGRLVKRAAPTAADYIQILPGGTHTAVFDPSSTFNMHQQGSYQIAYIVDGLDVRTTPPEVRSQAEGESLLAMADPDRPGPDTAPQSRAEVRGNGKTEFYFAGLPSHVGAASSVMTLIGGYTNCTTTQKSSLSTAHNNAISISGKAINNLTTYPSGSTLYKTWFGTYSSTRFNTVKSHFNAINNSFVNKSVVYDCGCTDSAYAYVYANQPYKIYLCRAFWSAPSLGRDSKAGTLVHEMSHFTVNGGTTDYVYGATGAKNLALSSPSKAVMNADNHEYFAEDQK